jgi:hypothetical protein
VSLQALRVRHVGPVVQVISGDKLVFEAPPHVMRELIGVMQQITGLAEEIEQRERIIFDNAILLRSGALPIGLIHNPHLLHQSGIEAAWNSHLRRYMPGGVKSREAFGVPTIINESDVSNEVPRD